jgi:hypothetical protein
MGREGVGPAYIGVERAFVVAVFIGSGRNLFNVLVKATFAFCTVASV